jgi:hypothetical protein
MKRGAFSVLVAGLFFLIPSASEAGERPIVAVFNLEARGVSLTPELLESLGDHLATIITAKGGWQVLPRSTIKERLRTQAKESFKECYDQSCQIELGKELAAQKTLSTQVMKLGGSCKVNMTLYDLMKAATESAASVSGECGEDGIVVSMERAVNQLVGIKEEAGEVRKTPPDPDRDDINSIGTFAYSSILGIKLEAYRVRGENFQLSFLTGHFMFPKGSLGSENWGAFGVGIAGIGYKWSFGAKLAHEFGILWYPLYFGMWRMADHFYVSDGGGGEFLDLILYYRYTARTWHLEVGAQSPLIWGNDSVYDATPPFQMYLGVGI